MLETHAIFYKTFSAPILQRGSEYRGLRNSLEHNAVFTPNMKIQRGNYTVVTLVFI